jgi:hypothetical protein
MGRGLILMSMIFLVLSCNKDDMPVKTIWYENIGSRTDLPFLPDGNVNYYLYSFKRNQGDKIGLRLTAEFPFARYMSYNIYDNRSRASLASLVDVDIEPVAGSTNPFVEGVQGSGRTYVMHVLPDVPEAEGYVNALRFDDNILNLGTMLRLYVPERSPTGGVQLPKIEAFDLATGRILKLPEPLPVDFRRFTGLTSAFEGVIGLTFLLQELGKVDFYRFSGAGLYQNFDNQYLFAPLILGRDEVAVFKVKPPTYAAQLPLIPTADVRYFSFCIGDAATYNYFTLADFECKVASDGFVYVVVGRDEPDLKQRAEGLNYLVWDPKLQNRGLIVYRNMLTRPGYPNNMGLVPDIIENIDKVFDTDVLRAKTYLGDFAPQGIKMNREAFLENFGGFQVAY